MWYPLCGSVSVYVCIIILICMHVFSPPPGNGYVCPLPPMSPGCGFACDSSFARICLMATSAQKLKPLASFTCFG